MEIFIFGRRIFIRRVGNFGKFFGLMFRSSGTDNLLFEFRKRDSYPIHSFFVFFLFLAVWLSGDEVVGCEIVKPFRFSVVPDKKFDKLVEIPLSGKNKKIVEFFVGKKRKV